MEHTLALAALAALDRTGYQHIYLVGSAYRQTGTYLRYLLTE